MDLCVMVTFWKENFHLAPPSIVKKKSVVHIDSHYLLILHLHFLLCPPHLPLPQSHLPPHSRCHLLIRSCSHRCFLRKKKEEGDLKHKYGTRIPAQDVI